MTQSHNSLDPISPSARFAATAIGVGLAVAVAALWFGWAARERSLEARTRDRLR